MNGYAALDGFSCPCYMAIKRAKAVDRYRPLKTMDILVYQCHPIEAYKAFVYGRSRC